MKTPSSPRQLFGRSSEGGAILIVAMLISAVIAVSLASYIALGKNSHRLANRSFYNTASVNFAETGIEEALWSFNQATAGIALATAWADWNVSDGVTAKRTFTDFNLDANATATVKVYVDTYNPAPNSTPKVVAQATVTIPAESRTITKVIEVTLRRRSKFAMGLVAKDTIDFQGNATLVDSWNSTYNDDGTLRASPVAYAEAYKKSNGGVGSVSVAVNNVAINHADIWGYASTGAATTAGVKVGKNGTIAKYGQPEKTLDWSRVATDFSMNLPIPTDPGSGTVLASMGSTLGTAGTTAVYRWDGTINNDLTVYGDVTLYLTCPAGSDAVSLSGGDALTVAAGSSLKIVTAGDITMTGNSLVNLNSTPSSFYIEATSTSAIAQTIDLGGTTTVSCVVDAPNAAVSIHGTPDVCGSIVGKTITVVGSAKFHYDESLALLGGNNPYGITKWRELVTNTERAVYSTQLSSF